MSWWGGKQRRVWTACLVFVVGFGCTALPTSTGTITDLASPEDGTPDTGTPPTTPPAPTGDTGIPCPAIAAITPVDGATDAYYRGPVRVQLAEPDASAVVRVFDEVTGADVPGASVVDGVDVVWTGDPLSPSSSYGVALDRACGTDTFGFATSAIGEPVQVDLVGRTYAIEPSAGVWIEPPGAGALMGVALIDSRLLVEVTAPPEADTIDLLMAVGYDARQAVCAPTLPFLDATWVDPWFEVHGDELLLQTPTFGVALTDFAMDGSFAADGSRLSGVAFQGVADTRALGAELGLGTDPEAICDIASLFYVACTPCPTDGAAYCLDLAVEGLEGLEVDLPLTEISPADVAANAACN